MRSTALAAAVALLGGCSASGGYLEANSLFEQGRYAEAIPLYERAVSGRERLKEAYYRLAYCYEVRGEESRAVEKLEQVLRVDPQDEYAFRHLWRLYCHRGFVEDALRMARGLEKLHPGDAGLTGEIARLESLKGK